MRACGECNLCCKWLYFNIDGEPVHPGKPCKFLGDNCTVHKIRPQLCRNYNCGYIQEIVPEWMKPSRSGVIVSTEMWGPNKEYPCLRAVEAGKRMPVEVLSWLIQYCRKNDIGLIYQLDGHYNFFGPNDFMDYHKAYQPVVDDPGKLILNA